MILFYHDLKVIVLQKNIQYKKYYYHKFTR